MLVSGSAWSMYTPICNTSGHGNIHKILPAATFTVPHTAVTGNLIGNWYNLPHFHPPHYKHIPVDFEICTHSHLARNGLSDGADKNLYALGEKPATTIAAPGNLTVTDDGMSFRVFTTPQLQSLGLGYIVRWRATNIWGETGQWGTPQDNTNWETQSNLYSTGVPFYRVHVHLQGSNINNPLDDLQAGSTTTTRFLNLADWYAYVNPLIDGTVIRFFYAVQVQIRYVLLASQSQEFEPLTGSTTVHLVNIKPRPDARITPTHSLNQTVSVNYAPWGTCTTGDVVVPLGAVWESALPNVGSTAPPRDFDITLTKCPKVNIGYSFVPPTGVGYNNSTGVLNMDSTATAQGVGIQLRHRNAPNYGNNTIQYTPTAPATPTYIRTAGQGVNNAIGGVDHSIPMRAAIYRTGPLQPGSVRASVIVHIVYP